MEELRQIGKVDTPQQFHQLGIFVLDGSGSMSDQAAGGTSKADAVNIAMRELLTRFKVSRAKKNFSFAVVNFDTSASLATPATPADQIDDNDDYNPMHGHGGGTYVHTGLEKAEAIAIDFLSQAPLNGAPHSVIILLMTDGMCHQPSESTQIADRIKNGPSSGQITICTTHFAKVGQPDQQAKDLLRNIASDPIMGFKEIYDAETLRGFFTQSIRSASGVMVG